MRIFDFLRNLIPSFTKDEVKEKLRLVSQMLQQTLEGYLSAVDVLGVPGFKSRAGKEFDNDFRSKVRTPFRGTSISVIQQVLSNVTNFIDQLSPLVEKSYNRDVVVDGLTYKRAEILRTLGYLDFMVTYARQLLHYLLVVEANFQAKTLPDGRELPKPEIDWLNANRATFFRLLLTFADNYRDLIKKLDDIPDINVGENDEQTIQHTVSVSRLDPLKNNFLPGITPMFMSIGIAWTQWQVKRYERLKEDVKVIQYRIEQLRLQAQGKQDAQLERTIAKYEEYLNDLAYDIAKMEQKWK